MECAAALKRSRFLTHRCALQCSAAVLRCSAEYEGPALQPGAAAAKEEARSFPFFLPKFEKIIQFSWFFN
jgi:hypothetical protein